MKLNDIKTRIEAAIHLADKTLSTRNVDDLVDQELFNQFRSLSLSTLISIYGDKHPYYTEFKHAVKEEDSRDVESGRGILKSVKSEIDNGWLSTLKGLVTSEIFSDFLEMAGHLLDEKYKDPAAVMIGSTLEEHLRQLCIKSGIAIEYAKGGDMVPKKADTLNSELASAIIYSKLDQKSVTSWLDLRNKAAHGKYSEYTIEQVNLMLQGVRDFIVRNGI